MVLTKRLLGFYCHTDTHNHSFHKETISCALLGALPLKYLPDAKCGCFCFPTKAFVRDMRIFHAFLHAVKYLACLFCMMDCIILLHQYRNLLNIVKRYESTQAFLHGFRKCQFKTNSQVRYCKLNEILFSNLCMLLSFGLDETVLTYVVSFVNTCQKRAGHFASAFPYSYRSLLFCCYMLVLIAVFPPWLKQTLFI